MTLSIKEVFLENKGSNNLSRKDKPTHSCATWPRPIPLRPPSSSGAFNPGWKTAQAELPMVAPDGAQSLNLNEQAVNLSRV